MRDKEDEARIRELAKQAGYQEDFAGIGHWDMPECKKFAELVRADEREACAKLLENGRFLHDEAPAKILAKEAAKAIRSRGER